MNADGEKLMTSDGPDGNIGCPVRPAEIDHFMTLIEKSSNMTPGTLQELRSALDEHAAPIVERLSRSETEID